MAARAHEPNLVLAGFMGTGKSAVGPLLAHALGREFVDTDALIEREAGKPVREIFAAQGEAAFRALERDACRRVANGRAQVIAVGGGALLDPGNMAALQSTGVMVLLTCRPEILVQRLAASAALGDRPLLQGDVLDTVRGLLNARHHCYSAVRLQVDTSDRTPQQVLREVLHLYNGAVEGRLEPVGQ